MDKAKGSKMIKILIYVSLFNFSCFRLHFNTPPHPHTRAHTHTQSMHVEVRTTCRNFFSPFTMWVPEVELRISGLVAQCLYPQSYLADKYILKLYFRSKYI